MVSVPEELPWDGRGLPPLAVQRIERLRDSGVAGSLLEVADAAALEGVGFTAVGEAMGCIVQHLGWSGGGCGLYYGGGFMPSTTISSGAGNRWAGLAPYTDALYRGWDVAIQRLLAEATALGADGVVGVTLKEHRLDEGGNREFVALGTAVRSRGRRHAQRPFATQLSGADTAKLLHAGWVPTGIALGIAVAVRHDDIATRQQISGWAYGNVQVDGYTELVETVRHDARTQLERRAKRLGGEAVLGARTGLHVWEYEPAENHVDHYAEATFTGTTAAPFHRGKAAPTSSLSILPLKRTSKETVR